MNGHHGHAVIVRLHAVEVRVEGDLIQEARESSVLRVLLQKAEDVGLQLLHVFNAAPALHIVFVLQRLDIAGLVQNLIVKFRQSQRTACLSQIVDQVGKLHQLGRGRFQRRE